MTNVADLILHATTESEFTRLLRQRPHAIILEAPAGSGKTAVSQWFARELTGVDNLAHIPAQVLVLSRGEDKSLKIDKVRAIERFLERKLSVNQPRVVVVQDAHTMTSDAQNALLKTLEEPPANTTIVLLAHSASSLLATIRSRSVLVTMRIPTPEQVSDYYIQAGYNEDQVKRAALMSGGLPGLMRTILDGAADSEELTAATEARQLIQTTRFQRLARVEALSKQKDLALMTCQMLQRMAHIRLTTDPLATQWQRILAAAYSAEEQLHASGQPKLVLTNLMLSF